MATGTTQRDFLRVVREDLRYLQTWLAGELDLEEVRRGSAVLRRLIGPDETLKKAWFDAMGASPFVIPSWRLEDVVANVPKGRLLLAAIGGSNFRNSIVGPMALTMGNEEVAFPAPEQLKTHSPSLKAFTRGDCLLIRDQRVSRFELIEYFADRLGGAHVGQRGDAKAYAALDQVPRYTAGRKDVRESINTGGFPKFGVEISHDGVVYWLDPLHAELLAIGQWVAKSPFTDVLIDRLLRVDA